MTGMLPSREIGLDAFDEFASVNVHQLQIDRKSRLGPYSRINAIAVRPCGVTTGLQARPRALVSKSHCANSRSSSTIRIVLGRMAETPKRSSAIEAFVNGENDRFRCVHVRWSQWSRRPTALLPFSFFRPSKNESGKNKVKVLPWPSLLSSFNFPRPADARAHD